MHSAWRSAGLGPVPFCNTISFRAEVEIADRGAKRLTSEGCALKVVSARTAQQRRLLMDMIDLRYLAAAVEFGTFARAAEALGRTTSTVSRRIARLEEELGLTLFERGNFGIRLTKGGRSVMAHAHRALASFDAVRRAGFHNGAGEIGEIRLGVRMPPVGEPLRSLLAEWRTSNPAVGISLFELNDGALSTALEERLLDVVLTTRHALPASAAFITLFRERLHAVLPVDHPLATETNLVWAMLQQETILVQDWDESHTAREFYASRVGSGATFRVHAAGKQAIFALVAAGYGITFAIESQTQASFPGVVYRLIAETDGVVEICLAWNKQSEEAVVGRFLAFMRDAAPSRSLIATA
jgi:DNA-binding transcriptional LysR family regulator